MFNIEKKVVEDDKSIYLKICIKGNDYPVHQVTNNNVFNSSCCESNVRSRFWLFVTLVLTNELTRFEDKGKDFYYG